MSRPSRSSSATARPGRSRTLDARQRRVDDVFAADRRVGRLADDHPQGTRGDRAHRARRRPRGRDDRPRRRAHRARASRPVSSTTIAGAFIAAHGGVSASKGYHGTYPAEICISPNDMVVHGIPGRYRVAGRRSDHDRRRRRARRRDRRQRLHLRRRVDRPRGAATARRLPGRACGRDRRGAPRQPHRRHLACRADGRRGRRLLGRAQPRRPRRRPPLPRGSARAELRRSRAGARGSPRG